MELFAIFRLGESQPIWAAVTDSVTATDKAVVAAVNGGSMELLSGTDLADRLKDNA